MEIWPFALPLCRRTPLTGTSLKTGLSSLVMTTSCPSSAVSIRRFAWAFALSKSISYIALTFTENTLSVCSFQILFPTSLCLSNAFKVGCFAVDRHVETRGLSGFIDFHRGDSVDDPEHHVSEDERPDRREADRA